MADDAQPPPYYYWCDEERNRDGESLQQCLEKYGIGRQTLPHLGAGIWMTVIFLSAKRSFGNSWCLSCIHRPSGVNVPVRLYENRRVYGTAPTSEQVRVLVNRRKI